MSTQRRSPYKCPVCGSKFYWKDIRKFKHLSTQERAEIQADLTTKTIALAAQYKCNPCTITKIRGKVFGPDKRPLYKK